MSGRNAGRLASPHNGSNVLHRGSPRDAAGMQQSPKEAVVGYPTASTCGIRGSPAPIDDLKAQIGELNEARGDLCPLSCLPLPLCGLALPPHTVYPNLPI